MLEDSLREKAEQYIINAECLFGPRMETWSFCGVEISDNKPALIYFPEHGTVAINLSTKVIGNEIQEIFQLSHEACHLLYPGMDRCTFEKPQTSTLNEGLSTYFSILMLEAANIDIEPVLYNLQTHYPPYFEALKLVTNLLKINPDIVKEVRTIEPQIDLLRQSHLVRYTSNLPENLLNNLLLPFS